MFPILTKKGQCIFCIHFFFLNKLKLAKTNAGHVFLLNQRSHGKIFADLEEKNIQNVCSQSVIPRPSLLSDITFL